MANEHKAVDALRAALQPQRTELDMIRQAYSEVAADGTEEDRSALRDIALSYAKNAQTPEEYRGIMQAAGMMEDGGPLVVSRDAFGDDVLDDENDPYSDGYIPQVNRPQPTTAPLSAELAALDRSWQTSELWHGEKLTRAKYVREQTRLNEALEAATEFDGKARELYETGDTKGLMQLQLGRSEYVVPDEYRMRQSANDVVIEGGEDFERQVRGAATREELRAAMQGGDKLGLMFESQQGGVGVDG